MVLRCRLLSLAARFHVNDRVMDLTGSEADAVTLQLLQTMIQVGRVLQDEGAKLAERAEALRRVCDREQEALLHKRLQAHRRELEELMDVQPSDERVGPEPTVNPLCATLLPEPKEAFDGTEALLPLAAKTLQDRLLQRQALIDPFSSYTAAV